MLKREIAPLTQLAWSEIDGRAEAVLKSRLTAGKAVTVNGPKGLDFTSVSEGRLELIDDDENLVKTGVFKIKPLVEARISFTLNRWELDNLTRGAKDIDLTNLEEAVQKIAEFEETAVYKGFDAGQIKGLETVSANEKIPFGETDSQIMEAISKGLVTLKEKFEAGPFVLIVGEVAYNRLNISSHGYPLIKQIEALIGGKILLSTVLDGAFLIPYDNPNFELTIGQDFAIGFESYDQEDVKLFITESFTFRVLDENIIIAYTV